MDIIQYVDVRHYSIVQRTEPHAVICFASTQLTGNLYNHQATNYSWVGGRQPQLLHLSGAVPQSRIRRLTTRKTTEWLPLVIVGGQVMMHCLTVSAPLLQRYAIVYSSTRNVWECSTVLRLRSPRRPCSVDLPQAQFKMVTSDFSVSLEPKNTIILVSCER